VPQAGVPYARGVQLALPVQRDGSVALLLAGSPQDELVLVLPPDDSAVLPEQRAARSHRAALDGSRVDSQALPAAQVVQQQAD